MLVAAYLIEAGLVLIVTPWTGFWTRNYFGQAWPWLGHVMFNPYVCGGITGLGIVTIVAGFRDLVSTFSARRAAVEHPIDSPRP